MITFVWKRVANYRIYIANKNHRTVAFSAVVSPLNGNNNNNKSINASSSNSEKKVVGVYLEDLLYLSCMRCGSQHLWCCFLCISLSVLRGSLSTPWQKYNVSCSTWHKVPTAYGRARANALMRTVLVVCHLNGYHFCA